MNPGWGRGPVSQPIPNGLDRTTKAGLGRCKETWGGAPESSIALRTIKIRSVASERSSVQQPLPGFICGKAGPRHPLRLAQQSLVLAATRDRGSPANRTVEAPLGPPIRCCSTSFSASSLLNPHDRAIQLSSRQGSSRWDYAYNGTSVHPILRPLPSLQRRQNHSVSRCNRNVANGGNR